MTGTLGNMDETAVDTVNFATQSPVRVDILQQLAATDRLTKTDLHERFDVSRVTIQRNLEALEERDWIHSDVHEYEISPLGELVATELASVVDTVDFAERIRPFLRWFPADDLTFDVRALADATVAVSDATDPYAPVNQHIEAMERADHARFLLPAIGLPAMSAARDCLERGQRQDLVYTPALVSTIRSEPEYRGLLEEMLSFDGCRVRVADREIAYYLGLFGDAVQIGVEDDDGIPRALVETGAAEIREWGQRTYESYWEGADPFSL